MDGFCQAFSSNLAPQKRLCKNGEKLKKKHFNGKKTYT